jgi:uncharacterized protein (TIGR03435 family)
LIFVAVALAATAGFAQTRPEFDVASLKVSPPPQTDKININLGTARHGVVTLANASLADCLRYAYSITNNEQIAGPDWITDKMVRFDIEGKAPPATPLAKLREMLQTLLVERFKLVYHTDKKNMTYVALVAAKGGSKLQEAEENPPANTQPMIAGRIISKRMTMSTLVTLLSRFMGETVVDMTGLTSWYDVKLEWTPDPPQNSRPVNGQPPPPVEPALGPSVFSAIEKQLGLKLERRKGPLDVLVIDHAEKTPVGN